MSENFISVSDDWAGRVEMARDSPQEAWSRWSAGGVLTPDADRAGASGEVA